MVDEHRRLYAYGGTFRDKFADSNAVHIYQIPERQFCKGPLARVARGGSIALRGTDPETRHRGRAPTNATLV